MKPGGVGRRYGRQGGSSRQLSQRANNLNAEQFKRGMRNSERGKRSWELGMRNSECGTRNAEGRSLLFCFRVPASASALNGRHRSVDRSARTPYHRSSRELAELDRTCASLRPDASAGRHDQCFKRQSIGRYAGHGGVLERERYSAGCQNGCAFPNLCRTRFIVRSVAGPG